MKIVEFLRPDGKPVSVRMSEGAEFGIEFPFEGDYSSVRNLLNLLELTPSFLILDAFNLSSSLVRSLSSVISWRIIIRLVEMCGL